MACTYSGGGRAELLGGGGALFKVQSMKFIHINTIQLNTIDVGIYSQVKRSKMCSAFIAAGNEILSYFNQTNSISK